MDSTLTAAQGRVLFHLGRLFRSTGAGIRELGEYRRRISETLGAQALADVELWSTADCVRALQIMEDCARPMAGFRDIRTGWEDFTWRTIDGLAGTIPTEAAARNIINLRTQGNGIVAPLASWAAHEYRIVREDGLVLIQARKATQ